MSRYHEPTNNYISHPGAQYNGHNSSHNINAPLGRSVIHDGTMRTSHYNEPIRTSHYNEPVRTEYVNAPVSSGYRTEPVNSHYRNEPSRIVEHGNSYTTPSRVGIAGSQSHVRSYADNQPRTYVDNQPRTYVDGGSQYHHPTQTSHHQPSHHQPSHHQPSGIQQHSRIHVSEAPRRAHSQGSPRNFRSQIADHPTKKSKKKGCCSRLCC